MRTIITIAALLVALGTAPPTAEAAERGFAISPVSPHGGAKFHRPHHRFEFHRGSLLGKHRHVKPRHFQRRLVQPGFTFRFDDGRFAFQFGHLPRFKPRHFHHHRHLRGGVWSRSDGPRHVVPGHRRGLAWGYRLPDARTFGEFGGGVVYRGPDGGASIRHVPSPDVLAQLEQMGFREVPPLLQERGHVPRRVMGPLDSR